MIGLAYCLGWIWPAILGGVGLSLVVAVIIASAKKMPFGVVYFRAYLPVYAALVWNTIRNNVASASFNGIPVEEVTSGMMSQHYSQAAVTATFCSILTALPAIAVWMGKSMTTRIVITVLASLIPCLFLKT
jgi:hypothetical protein